MTSVSSSSIILFPLTLLRPYWLPSFSSNMPDLLTPQDLCTGCSLCQTSSSPRHPHGESPWSLSSLTHKSSFHWEIYICYFPLCLNDFPAKSFRALGFPGVKRWKKEGCRGLELSTWSCSHLYLKTAVLEEPWQGLCMPRLSSTGSVMANTERPFHWSFQVFSSPCEMIMGVDFGLTVPGVCCGTLQLSVYM